MATARPSRVSTARKTSPMPPSPSLLSMRYGPRRAPAVERNASSSRWSMACWTAGRSRNSPPLRSRAATRLHGGIRDLPAPAAPPARRQSPHALHDRALRFAGTAPSSWGWNHHTDSTDSSRATARWNRGPGAGQSRRGEQSSSMPSASSCCRAWIGRADPCRPAKSKRPREAHFRVANRRRSQAARTSQFRISGARVRIRSSRSLNRPITAAAGRTETMPDSFRARTRRTNDRCAIGRRIEIRGYKRILTRHPQNALSSRHDECRLLSRTARERS